MKAPRLIARSSVALVRWATLDRFRKAPAGEIERDLATTPNPFASSRSDVPVTLQRSRVQPPVAIVRRPLLVGTAPAGV